LPHPANSLRRGPSKVISITTMLSVTTAITKALDSAKDAVEHAQGHLDACKKHFAECEAHAGLANFISMELDTLVQRYAGSCPAISNGVDHEYVMGIDFGESNPQNIGRHFQLVGFSFIFIGDANPIRSAPKRPTRL
jgi:hypothetical protein